jgi:hypothetical protein
MVENGLVIGKSSNEEPTLLSKSPHGVISPRTEYFTVKNTKFYNFNFNNAAALGDCSHCFHPAATDSGARTTKTIGLYFDSTVTKRIKYQYPNTGIY